MTLPAPLVEQIDRVERNRSRFVLEAVQHELERRRREQLLLSLENPHPETADLEATGLEDWFANLPEEEDDLVLPGAGTPLLWVPGEGWRIPDECS